MGSDPVVKEKFDAWLLHLPQVLWELGNGNLVATEVSTWSTVFSDVHSSHGSRVDDSPGTSPHTAAPVEIFAPN